MRILLAGSKGQLAGAFIRRFQKAGAECSGFDADVLDISNAAGVFEAVRAYKPGVIINCAAYNLVDMAESEKEKAFSVNATGALNLAEAAREIGAFFVHYGSDYVFDGLKQVPYTESDIPNPVNTYGLSKLKGEEFVSASGARSLILRLSWVFGPDGRNFIHKLRAWAQRPGELRVSTDEISVPAYVEDVAFVTMAALKCGITGIRHLTNTGFCSRYDWAKLILKEYGIKKEIVPARMADFGLAARRPGFSAMSNAAISKELGLKIPAWEVSTADFIKRAKETP